MKVLPSYIDLLIRKVWRGCYKGVLISVQGYCGRPRVWAAEAAAAIDNWISIGIEGTWDIIGDKNLDTNFRVEINWLDLSFWDEEEEVMIK